MKFICTTILLLICGAYFIIKFRDKRNLVKLSVIFRHGDRMPMQSDVPTDYYKNISFNLPPPESLTKIGEERSRNLGYKLRKEYTNFLGIYSPEDVEVYSSPVQRCKDTFMIMSKTLYPRNTTQDIPYISTNYYEDKLLAIIYSCAEEFNREDYPIENPEDVEFFKKISEIIGKKLENYREAVGLYDYIKVMNQNGYGMPKWAVENWGGFNKAYLNFWKIFAIKHATIGAGNLIHKIAKDSLSITGEESPKINIYSGHDYNIIFLLHLLKSFDATVINYCSYIAFEVHKSLLGIYYIEVYFDNEDGNGRKQIQIPGCNFRCTVSQFLDFTEQFYRGDKWCENI